MSILQRLIPIFLFSLAGVTTSYALEADSAPRPNILLIITDQQFADVMGCAGCRGIETPAMDSLAKEGVRFTHAYVNYPVCLPERYSMFTGRLPCTRRLADSEHKPRISLGNQAKQGGYATAYFGKWHIQDKTFDRDDVAYHGFDLNTGGKDLEMTDAAIHFLSEANRIDRDSPAPTHEYVVSEAEVSKGPKASYDGRSLRTPEYKYHVWSRGEHREQLFDMINDPGETRNLAGLPEYAGQLQKHRNLFAEWLNATDDTYREN